MLNTFDWFRKWNAYTPDKVALKDGDTGETLNYGQLHQGSTALANHLVNHHKLKKGDRVAIIAENHLAQVLLFGAAQKCGVVLVPINYRLAPAEIEYQLGDAQCKLVFFNKVTYDIDSLDYEANYESLPDLMRFITMESPEISCDLRDDDAIFILYTSGTTGLPKGTLYTHKMLFWNSVNTALSLNLTSTTRTLNCMPLFHTGGWNVLLTPLLHRGGTVIMFTKFDAQMVLKTIVVERLNLFMGVPTMLKMIQELQEFEDTDISFLDYIIVGGESMPIPLIEAYHEKEVPIRQGYGMTEVGPNLTSLHQSEAIRKQGSIGKPNFYVQMKIMDDEGLQVFGNESGELWVSGPMVTPGYWNNDKATKDSIEDSWFKTGDVAKMDEEGFIYIVDRKKNMYISGGENVYPVEVERVLLQCEFVKEAVVFGVPDDKWGECGVALIIAEGQENVEAIKTHCLERLAKFKIPKIIEFVTEIPKGDTGKIHRKKIQEDYIKALLAKG